mgnify:CR=1 FL=1
MITQGIGSTIPSASSRQHDDAILTRGTQTFEDSDTDSLAWDTLSEEFPLLIGSFSSPKQELELDNCSSCSARIDKQTAAHPVNTSVVNTEKRHHCKEKSSGRVRHAPKKYTPNSNKNKVYCYCQNEDSGWYLKCDYVFPGCLEYYHAKCVGLEILKDRECAKKYSNCNDGTSYACPSCFKRIHKNEERLAVKEEGNFPVSQTDLQKVREATIEINESKTAEEYGHEKMIENNNAEHQQTELFDVESYSDIDSPACSPSFGLNDDHFPVVSFENELDEEEKAAEGDVPFMDLEASLAEVNNDEIKSVKNSENEILPENTMLFDSESNMDEDDAIIADIELEDLKFSDYETKQNDVGNTDDVLPVSEQTLKTLMDCPKLTLNTFFVTEIPSKASFRLTDDEWIQIEPSIEKPDKLQPCWTSVMARHLSESNDYYTFRFKRHFIQRQSSRKRQCDIFKASGNCVFVDCTCSFKLCMSRTQFQMKEISVHYEGNVKHATGERQSRFIQNTERKALAARFKEKGCKPSKVYQELKESLTSNAKASGNRTGCGVQPTTIRKIESESRQNEYLSKDMVESLLIIRKLFIEKERLRNKPPSKIEGFIHTISVHPLIVCMWSEGQIRLWHDRVLHDVAYLDATGTIVANYNGKRSLYYALAVRHPTVGNPPIPVAEMVTNDHSALKIRGFLEKLKRDDGKVFHGKDVTPHQITTDYSKAIILAVLREFNNESLTSFFTRAYRLMRREGTDEDVKLTIPHVGCSHFMHIVHKNLSAIRRLKQTAKGSDGSSHGSVWYRFNMYCMSLLVNASTLEEFDTILKDATVCLMSKFLVARVHESYNKITGRVEKIGLKKMDDVVDNACEFDDSIPTDATGESSVPALINPFNIHFDDILSPIIAEIEFDNKSDSDHFEEKTSWCPEFFTFMRSYITEMPLWSGVLLGSLERYKKSGNMKAQEKKINSDETFLSYKSANAKSEEYIEGIMRQLKQEDSPGKKRMRADAFALENYERTRRRLNDFGDRIHIALNPKPKRKYRKRKLNVGDSISQKEKRKKKDENDDYHMVEETWGKRDPSTPKTNPKLGQFQQSPKVPFSDSPTVKKENKNSDETKSTSAFLLFLNKKRRGLKRKYRNDEKVVSEATNIWRSMSTDEKEKYHRLAKEKDIMKGKTNNKAKRFSVSETEENVGDIGEWCQYMYKGLQNKGNDCWLNSMLQCINHLTIRNRIIESSDKDISPLASALIEAMKKMEKRKAIPFYPDELHSIFQRQFFYQAHTQNDIHESLIQLLAPDETYEDVFTHHFQHEIQFTKICEKCAKRKSIAPEKLTTTFIPLCEDVIDVSDALYKSYIENTLKSTCENCQEDTEHIRIATLLALPDVLLLMFKRFENVGARGKKLHSKVQLQKQITLITEEPCQYVLRACALHHGANLYSGHYTALLFEGNNVVELDDTHVKCVTNEWEDRATSTVYLAFYCKDQDCTLSEHNIMKQTKIDPTDTNNAKKPSKKKSTRSLNGSSKSTKFKINDAYFDKEGSIMNEATKKMNKIWDISMKDTKICSSHEHGYDLHGIDFKTLEISRRNDSYEREKPGWLNDNIVDAYLQMLTGSALKTGKRIISFSCLFYSSLEKAVRFRNVNKIYRILIKYYRNEIFESYDFIVFPINIGDQHWCVVVVDMWNQKIFYYDPLHTGATNLSVISNIVVFLTMSSTARGRLAKFDCKKFVTDFAVCSESHFPLQTDGASCGVFILLYVSNKIGLISTSRTKKTNDAVRTIIGYELLKNCIVCDEMKENFERSCQVMSLLRQENGRNATLHCMTVGVKPENFQWVVNNKVIFKSQTPNIYL